jgi:outer membrane protein assembly factor BamB
LERSWYTYVQVGLGDELRHVAVHVSPSKSFTVIEVKHAGGTTYFTERDPNAFGAPIGVEEAQRLAELRQHQLRAMGQEPQVETKQIPEVVLFAQTARGGLQAIDGETGRTLWYVQVGVPNYPTQPVGATDEHVVAINGSQLHVFEQPTGRFLWQRPLKGVPTAGPALGGGLIYAPTLGGMIEAHRLDGADAPSLSLRSSGRILHSPTIAQKVISWPTDRGYLYLATVGGPGLRFRLEAQDTITSRTAFAPPSSLFAASLDGYVYAVNQVDGNVLWRFSAGEPLSQTPVAIDDVVYAVTDGDTLYCIGASSGEEKWGVAGVSRVLSVSSDRIYCLDTTARMVALDRNTGRRVGALAVLRNDLPVVNTRTDRIYLASRHGLVQCLHEQGRTWPLTRIIPEPSVETTPATTDQPPETEAATQPSPPPTPSPERPSEAVNPFEDEAAGGEAAPPSDDADLPPDDAEAPADNQAEPPADESPADSEDPFGVGS